MNSMRKWLVAALAAWCAAAVAHTGSSSALRASELVRAWERPCALTQAEIGVGALPKEAREVLVLIRAGGPFPYERDGVTFGNREGNLPEKARGYYREYTVPTPGARNRGARRIVCGGPQRVATACYYTSDHYRTFARIRE